MHIDWLSLVIGWFVGGIPSGWFANLLFHKYLNWKRRKGVYLSTITLPEGVEFSGRYYHNTAMAKEVRETLGAVLGMKPTRAVKSRKKQQPSKYHSKSN